MGGLASGYIIPKCGVRYPTIFSGLSCSLGISLCGMLLWTKSIILMVVIQEREWLEEKMGRKKKVRKKVARKKGFKKSGQKSGYKKVVIKS